MSFYRVLENMMNLSTRIGSRLDKMATAGINVSSAKLKLAEANAKLDQAKLMFETLSASVSDTASVTELSAKKDLFDQAKVAKNMLKEAHSLMNDAVKIMRSLSSTKIENNVKIKVENNTEVNSDSSN